MPQLDQQSVLITGGASGLGRAIVARFLAEGAHVTILDRNADALAEMEREYEGRVAGLIGDVRSLAANEAAVSLACDRFGKLDCLIANAGIWDYDVSLVDLPASAIDAAFDELFSINTKGSLLAMKAATPALVRATGSIILTLSNAAFYPGGGGMLYTASKHANLGLMRQAAYELAPSVRVNAVAPGAIATNLRGLATLGQDKRAIGSDLPLEEYLKVGVPLARLPDVAEFTGAYVLLASRKDGAVATGAVIQIDGGIGVRGLAGVSGGTSLAERFAE
ncbi:3-(cis-5,6-dihydroxycyclohexa-1,3-dien-1-yl)propanoate dehydrogenase [Sphingomonas sp. IC081]|uniref:Dehydrogenase n=1 Tax=Sphingomonas sp. CB3 TaxID=76582 RepID=O85287_9SPHN|nr:3-(cis-5,6-dihydroxycyclohexa-1,3-dien-1-yl)propanoate dehydrogenase [Sphingomonas sp. IC081]AAC38620.1 dehydrogenase [Sphingomonas sp. CB3]QDK35716.1 3-(cis-5,6-dihydroxycyclohexa-1,3-dien-1-yl)propanoate dehydrogenase [Sphingomonas sp. IC081]